MSETGFSLLKVTSIRRMNIFLMFLFLLIIISIASVKSRLVSTGILASSSSDYNSYEVDFDVDDISGSSYSWGDYNTFITQPFHKEEEANHPILSPKIEEILAAVNYQQSFGYGNLDASQPLTPLDDSFLYQNLDVDHLHHDYSDDVDEEVEGMESIHSHRSSKLSLQATTYSSTFTVNNVNDNYPPNKLYCASPNQYPNLCNFRSAWMSCVDKNLQTCQVVLPANTAVYLNRTMKALQVKGSSRVDINGKNSTIKSVGTFNSNPVQVHNASFPYYTQPLSNTNFDQRGYAESCVYACPGALLNFSTCNNYTTGDTYLRLFSGTKQLAENDDYCGSASVLVYELPLSGTCQNYCLRMGCYAEDSCQMKVTVTIEQNPLPQMLLYVSQKLDVPPIIGIYNVTIVNFGTSIANGGAISINGNIQLNIQNTVFRGNYAATGGALAVANNGNGRVNIFNVQCTNYVHSKDTPIPGDFYFFSNNSNINIRGVTLTSGISIAGNSGNRHIYIRNSKLLYYGINIGGNSATDVIIDNVIIDQSYSSAVNLVQNIYGGTISNIQITNMHANGNWVYLGPGSYGVVVNNINIVCNPSHNFTAYVYTTVKSANNITLSNIYGTNCKAPQLSVGIGVYLLTSTNIRLNNIQISNFRGSYGPGMFMQACSNINITNSVFSGCRSGLSGAGITLNEDNNLVRIYNTTIAYNKANGFGGGVYIGSSNTRVAIAGCNITGNGAVVSGGGVFLSQSNYLFSMMDLEGSLNTAYLETAHPYVVPFTDQGYTLESHSVIYNATVNVPGATEFIITFDAQTQFQTGLSANFYYNENDQDPFMTYKTATLMPGLGNPSVRIPVSSFYFTFEGPAEKTYVTSGLWGIKLYAYPIIANPKFPTTITNNRAITKGGGITFYYSNQFTVLSNLIVQGNKANAGGGIVYQNGNPSGYMQNTVFLQNKAKTDGGGLMIQSGQFGISMKNCQWIGNQAGRNGGAQYYGYSNGAGVFFTANIIVCQYCTMTSNVAAQSGGGMYVSDENLFSIMNSTLQGNVARVSDGGGISVYQDSFGYVGNTTFEGNIASGKGGAFSSDISNGISFQDVDFIGNVAGVGGGIATVNATALSFFQEIRFIGNKANDAGGGIYLGGSPIWTYNEDSTTLLFSNNTALRGSALCMFQSVTLNPYFKVTNATFSYNYADVGGTIYWIYDHVMSSEPNIRSSSNVFIDNKAGYGVFAATQPIQMITPVTYNVTVYNNYIDPPINVTLYDYYNQKIEVDGYTAVYPSVGDYNCTTYPFLSGPDLFGDGVPLSSGVSTFNKLQASCSPSGSFTMQYVAQVAITTTVPEDLRSTYDLYNSTFVTFRKCRIGEYETNGQCVVCPSGTYSLELGATQCYSCAEITGVDTCQGDQMVLKQGYWRRHGYSSSVLQCLLDPTSCVGGTVTGSASCALGYEGPLCAVCSSGYYLTNNMCQPCAGSDAFSSTTIAYIVVFGLIIILIWVVIRYARPKAPPDAVKRQMQGDSDDEEEAVAAMIPLDQQSTLTRIYLWAKAKYGEIVVKLKIIVSTYQVISNTSKVMNVQLPNPFASFSTSLLFFNVAISVLPLSCMGSYNFVDTILWATLFPIFIAFLLLVGFCAEFLYIRQKIKKSTTKVKGMKRQAFDATKSKYLNYFFFLSYLVLPSVTTTLFQWFICANVDPDGQDHDQYDLYLVSDMSISCQTDYYKSWTVYVVLMIMVYPIGIPALYLYLLRKHREELINRDDENHISHNEESEESLPAFVLAQKQGRVFDNQDDEEQGSSGKSSGKRSQGRHGSFNDDDSGHGSSSNGGSGRESLSAAATGDSTLRGSVYERDNKRREKHDRMSPTARRLAFLWQAYKPQYWYWEIIETTRKLMLTAVLSVCSPGSSEQSIFGVIMAWAYITLYSYYQPYEGGSDNVLAAAGQIQIFFTFFAALIIQNNLMGKDWNLLLGIVLTILNTVIIFLSFYFEVENYQIEMKEKKEGEAKQREKMNQIRMAKRLEFANKAGEEIVAVPVVFQKRQAKELVEDDPSTRMQQSNDDGDGYGVVVNKMHQSSSSKKVKSPTHSGKSHQGYSGNEVELTTFSGSNHGRISNNNSGRTGTFSGVQSNIDSDDED